MSACDIIIPIWNQAVFTRDCIDSIRKNTRLDYRLILVDNGSDEATRRYLEEVTSSGASGVILLRNESNLGFVKAVNQGIAVSTAPALCILNNDTLVTEGWLEEMLAILDSRKEIGIVNPSSNNLGQRPEKDQPLELYAEGLRSERGKSVELGAAIGFCMLIKRSLIDRIGTFDEVYGMGNFEDTDFSRRAIKEGFRCVRACGAYVYHREGASFDRVVTFERDFRRNKEIYESRWGISKRIAYILDDYDNNILKRVWAESLRLARDGNRVWCFTRDDISLPAHSNISKVTLPARNFHLLAAFRILKKKKRFDEILVGETGFGKFLEKLSFIHNAKVGYY